ncbi:MAG: TIR domain-containing protein [Clostridium septicum]|uniref:TIR domain-containing protein n=1 Tax=Clostridium septicum TaxID=1504 RepID=UPI002903B4D4|nr:TIR domain-containing protein [Clostridium septicum]MDU1312479.1 TIR domain-containing protein [Clostridium septicum]
MFFNIQDLEKRANSKSLTESFASYELSSLNKSFNSSKTYDIFLSHSYLDAKYIKLIRDDLVSLGYSVYVDWIEDKSLDRTQVTSETAEQLRIRMKQSKCLFYATTENYQKSSWMPWELGYFDALKDKVAILPVKSKPDSSEQYNGTEYLGLYSYITITKDTNQKECLWVNNNKDEYVVFNRWLEGEKPQFRDK